ncbi:MAG: hypothetical protein KGQ66_16225 [Acidobacteriota bacterium]|nr:hypothetical protein [Acidobacteriota bacterium]
MNVSGLGAGWPAAMAGAGSNTGVGAATWSGASRMGGPGSVGRMQSAVTSMAQLLGTTPSQLAAQLGQGQSLMSVANGYGVSSSSVISAIARGLTNSVPQGASPSSPDALQTIAARIAHATDVPAGLATS